MSNFSRMAAIKLCAFRASLIAGEDAIMRKEGGRLVIEAAPRKSLLALLSTLAPLDDDFPRIADPPPETVEL